MKLNAVSELMPLSWPEVNSVHPFVPTEQTQGYQEMITELTKWLKVILLIISLNFRFAPNMMPFPIRAIQELKENTMDY